MTDHDEARRELREQVDLLWRTSQLRVKAMDPIDEVGTVMTVLDETLFRVVPTVYRELDRAVAAAVSGPGRRVGDAGGAGAAFLSPAARWADRDGGPSHRAGHRPARDDPGRSHPVRAGKRHDQDRPGTDPARGDRAADRGPAPGAGLGLGRAPGTDRRDRGPVTAGALPDLPAVRGAGDERDPGPARRPGLPWTS